MLQITFSFIPGIKTASEELNKWYFLNLHFGRQANWGGEGYSSPTDYATVCEISFPSDVEKGRLNSLSLLRCLTDCNLNFAQEGGLD